MARKGLRRGIFITFEGAEGCGKTTHSKLLFGYLRGLGFSCIHTREPGGTGLGEEIRKILLHSDAVKISDLAELFLFEACRAQIVGEVIWPALDGRKIVICDRYSDATVSYQGYGGRLGLKDIGILNGIATGGLVPDLTVLLDVDTLTGLKRARSKGAADRIEAKQIAYHRRVRAGYLELAGKYPSRIKVIKVTGQVEETQEIVRREAVNVIQRYKRAG